MDPSKDVTPDEKPVYYFGQSQSFDAVSIVAKRFYDKYSYFEGTETLGLDKNQELIRDETWVEVVREMDLKNIPAGDEMDCVWNYQSNTEVQQVMDFLRNHSRFVEVTTGLMTE